MSKGANHLECRRSRHSLMACSKLDVFRLEFRLSVCGLFFGVTGSVKVTHDHEFLARCSDQVSIRSGSWEKLACVSLRPMGQ